MHLVIDLGVAYVDINLVMQGIEWVLQGVLESFWTISYAPVYLYMLGGKM